MNLTNYRQQLDLLNQRLVENLASFWPSQCRDDLDKQEVQKRHLFWQAFLRWMIDTVKDKDLQQTLGKLMRKPSLVEKRLLARVDFIGLDGRAGRLSSDWIGRLQTLWQPFMEGKQQLSISQLFFWRSFEERLLVVMEVAHYKRQARLPMRNVDREEEILQEMRELAQKLRLEVEMVRILFDGCIFPLSFALEDELMAH